MIGTPEYMCPEQVEAKDVDQRSDIYSLGIILYEMATGRVPFEGETALSVAMKHKGRSRRIRSSSIPAIPDDLSGVILKCLEKDRASDIQSAADLRASSTDRKGHSRRPSASSRNEARASKKITVPFEAKKLTIPADRADRRSPPPVLTDLVGPVREKPRFPLLSDKPTLAVDVF